MPLSRLLACAFVFPVLPSGRAWSVVVALPLPSPSAGRKSPLKPEASWFDHLGRLNVAGVPSGLIGIWNSAQRVSRSSS
jgi:hypothetical protein